MNHCRHGLGPITSHGRCRCFNGFFQATGALALLFLTSALHAQSPPRIESLRPADGATGVATNTTVVFVFDQDMDLVKRPFPSFLPTLIGNFEFQPSTLFLNGSWGVDKRTLTIKCPAGFPFDTVISWTLNPPEATLIPLLTSAAGQVLESVSGSFRTAPYIPPPPVPKLISITPTNNATEVSPNGPVTFVFDLEMDTSMAPVASTPPSVIGNYQFTVSSGRLAPTVSFSGSWSSDKRTLTFQPGVSLGLNSRVTWTLNPGATTVPLKSAMGQPLAFATGSFITIANTGGSPNEICPPIPPTTGFYTLLKSVNHVQTSENTFLLSSELPASFDAFVQSPPSGKRGTKRSMSIGLQQTLPSGKVTNASITLPTGIELMLTNQLVGSPRGGAAATGNLILHDSVSNEAALESTYPPGIYTMRLSQEAQSEHAIPLEMPATPPSIPKIANYIEAQSIDAAQSFTLRWNLYSPPAPGGFIELRITDESGSLIFQAPSPCVPRTLDPGATSVEIPAGYLRPGLTYNGVLLFGLKFYHSTNDVPLMLGDGIVQRTTAFTLKMSNSSGGAGPPLPPRFNGHPALANGRAELSLSGSVGKRYTIERSGSLTRPDWIPVGTVTPGASGTAAFEDSDSRLNLPAFYRATSP